MIQIMCNPVIERLAQLAEGEVELLVGQMLFSAGEPVRSMYVMREGSVRLVRHHPTGASVVLQRAGPGHLLAEASMFAARYHCDAIPTVPHGCGGSHGRRFEGGSLKSRIG